MDSRLSQPAYFQEASALAVQAVEGMPFFRSCGCKDLGTAASPLAAGKSLRAKASFYAAVLGRCRAGIYGKRVARRGGGVFLDVGANAGVYTLWAASLGLGVQIEAFEPDPELCERLQANLNRNNIEKVRLHSVALGNPQKPYVVLLRNERNLGRNRLVDARHHKGIAVSVRPLWEILQERNIGRVDVLKIDVEGHEEEILLPFFSQAPQSLWPKSVICELPRKGRGLQNCRVASLLAERQYTLLRRTRMNGIFQRPAEKENG